MLLRRLLLFLSRQAWLRRWVEKSRLSRPLVRRFVAGADLDEALAVCNRLLHDGILVTLDRLGENVTSLDEAGASRDAYVEALARTAGNGLSATVSIKLTQFGLDISPSECRRNVAVLAEAARQAGTRVEIDMESSEYVDRTLEMVHDMHARYGNVRAVIQAYLYRSANDVDVLCRAGIPVRLCKGAYREPPGVAFPRKTQVDANYRALMHKLLQDGVDPAIASHDESILRDALRWADKLRLSPLRFEFQMLYGIRRDLQRELAARWHRLRLYVPFGEAWYPYFMRRLAERPANLIFLLRHLARR